MNPRRRLVFCSALAGSFGATACTALVQEPPTMKATAPVTAESVIAFLHHFEALAMKECLLRGDFPGLVESMRLGWENKKRSAKTVSNPHIDAIYDAAIQAGALAGKVSGAGGGGFMWFFVLTEKRMDVIRTLNGFGGQVSNCHFTKHGTQAWRIT